MTGAEHDREISSARAALDRGRKCYARREWTHAFAALTLAARVKPLSVEDLWRLVWSAGLSGEDSAFLGELERLHQLLVEAEEPAAAARAAFWIGLRLFALGEPGRATGWLGRAHRLLERAGNDCVERGYLLLPLVFRHLGAGDDKAAHDVAAEAAAIGDRFTEPDLVALARNLQGRALLRQGEVEPGLSLLDEVMVAVTANDLSPLVTGMVYCNVIATCELVYALDRAREWTSALASWCDDQPQLITFTGSCKVHRARLMQLAGDWLQAIEQARRIQSERADSEVLGDAYYEQAEIHRLRGEVPDAEEAYGLASECGRDPQPGLALLRLQQGRVDAATAAIRRVLATTTEPWRRAHMLPAAVDILLSAGELGEARVACSELQHIADRFGTEIVGALAAHALGAVRLADGDARAAIEPLQRAFALWQRAGSPYNAARLRVLQAAAFRALGDIDGAELEVRAARQVFEQLGAAPDIKALEVALDRAAAVPFHNLSPRELEVLRLVASGQTNKEIAGKLFISERTIDRHVSNIFAKIDVSTRAAATAFAYQNKLL